MYKDVLRSIQDIGLFPVISFVLFFLFFLAVLVWVMFYKQDRIKKLKNLPFEEGQKNEDLNSDNKDQENSKS